MDWRQSEILELISMYRESECLWNPLSLEYKDVDLRMSTWDDFANHFGKDVAELKRKVKNLRSAYVTEKKKVDSLKKSDGEEQAYIPRLFYYDEMTFLDPVIVLRDTTLWERSGQPARRQKPNRTPTNKKKRIDEKKKCFDYVDVKVEEPFKELSPTKPSEHKGTSTEIHPPENNTQVHVEPSKEETFCAMLCSELKLIHSEDVYDNVTSEIFALVKSAKATERQIKYQMEESKRT